MNEPKSVFRLFEFEVVSSKRTNALLRVFMLQLSTVKRDLCSITCD